jgi:hypothetical protein
MDPIGDRVTIHGKAPEQISHPIRLGGAVLGPPRHICAFFNSRDDEYRVLLPFIKDGLECGEKAVHTVDPERRDEHLQRLASAGIDVAGARESGQLDRRHLLQHRERSLPEHHRHDGLNGPGEKYMCTASSKELADSRFSLGNGRSPSNCAQAS